MVDPDMLGLMIDIGHDRMKIGFSGDDAPRACFPTIVGRPKNPGIMVGMDAKDCFVGDEAHAKRGILKIRKPIPICRMEEYNFHDLEKIFHHSFYNELKVTPEEHPLIITSLPDRMSKNTFLIMTEMFFSTFDVPALSILDPHVFSLFSYGMITGQVLECGSGTTSTVSIHEGLPIRHTKMVLEDKTKKWEKKMAGDLITDVFLTQMRQNKRFEIDSRLGPTFKDLEIAKKMKEMLTCFTIDEDLANSSMRQRVPYPEHNVVKPEPNSSPFYGDNEYYRRDYERKMIEYNNEIQRNSERGTIINYSLPDGEKIGGNKKSSVVEVGDERFDAPEILFKPSLIGFNLPGIHELIKCSIDKNDPDLKEEMYKNLIISGGTTKIGNFQSKLHLELMKIIPPQEKLYRKALRVRASEERMYSAWIGGSILSSLSTYQNEWVTKAEYEEFGAGYIEAKCCMASTENLMQETLSIFVVDQDAEERRIFAFEECFVGVRKQEDDDNTSIEDGMEVEFRVSIVGSCDLEVRFKSLLL